MKKKILLFTLAAGLSSLVISSYITGAANNGYSCTGAETGLGNPTGCSTGSGCHANSATAGITVALELDSAGIPTTHYKGGLTYTIKITGTNTTVDSLPGFGFQIGVITGSVAATTPTNAGTWASTGLPASTRYSAASAGNYVLNIVEQSTRIVHTTGTGKAGTTYVESFTWTAPATGTGTISIWGALNAVNGDGNASSADLWNLNHVVIPEWSATAAVAAVTDNINVTAFPNPVINNLQLQMNDAAQGTYGLQVFDMQGRTVAKENIEVSGTSYHTNINTANWASGNYNVVISKGADKKVITVVKK